MPNAAGKTATRGRGKATSSEETGVAGETPKAERHVRTPLERAEAARDKAKATVAKIEKKYNEALAKANELKPELQLARDELEYAAAHPLLRKQAREQGDEPIALNVVSDDQLALADGFADGSEIVSTVPDTDEDDSDVGDPDVATDEDTSSVPGFDFDAALSSAPAVPQQVGNPFDQPGQQTVHV